MKGGGRLTLDPIGGKNTPKPDGGGAGSRDSVAGTRGPPTGVVPDVIIRNMADFYEFIGGEDGDLMPDGAPIDSRKKKSPSKGSSSSSSGAGSGGPEVNKKSSSNTSTSSSQNARSSNSSEQGGRSQEEEDGDLSSIEPMEGDLSPSQREYLERKIHQDHVISRIKDMHKPNMTCASIPGANNSEFLRSNNVRFGLV